MLFTDVCRKIGKIQEYLFWNLEIGKIWRTWKLNGLDVNAQLTRWFVSFAEFSCSQYTSTLGPKFKLVNAKPLPIDRHVRAIFYRVCHQYFGIICLHQSINQSNQIYIAPYVASESEARVGGARRSVHVYCKQCQTVLILKVVWKYWEVQQIYSCMTLVGVLILVLFRSKFK